MISLTLLLRPGSWLLRLACLFSALVFITPAQASDSLRCGSRIISTGAIAPAVLAACGEPSYRDVWRYYDEGFAQYVGDTEVWTYNFGPNRLLRVLRFRGGHLHAIETDGYGFATPTEGHCEPNAILEGFSKYRLWAYCGEPVAKRALGYLAPYRSRDGYEPPDRFLSPSYREEWTYNFGSSYLLLHVMLENGRVIAIENGERGYDPP